MGIEDISDIEYDNARYNKYRFLEKSVTLTGAAGLGAIGSVALFTVTGTVIARVIAVCSTNLAGASSTVEVGVTGGTDALIATTTATDIDSGEIWHDASPDSPIELSSVGTENIIAKGANIIMTVKVANATAGALKFFIIWKPVSSDGKIVAS